MFKMLEMCFTLDEHHFIHGFLFFSQNVFLTSLLRFANRCLTDDFLFIESAEEKVPCQVTIVTQID